MSATVTDYAEQVKELIESARCAEPSYNCEESAPLHERDLFNSITTALQQVHDAAILAERDRIAAEIKERGTRFENELRYARGDGRRILEAQHNLCNDLVAAIGINSDD